MAITGVSALLLSAWAVWLLNKTLKATRAAVAAADDAVVVTRDLGEAQIRAYLYCRSAKYQLSKERIAAILDIGNAGQSPASEVYVTGSVTIHHVGGWASRPRVVAWAISESVDVAGQPIPANGNSIERTDFFWDIHFPPEDGEDIGYRRALAKDGNEAWFNLSIRWRDVFGKPHELPVELTAFVDASPANPKKKRAASGKMEFRMADARPGDVMEATEQPKP